MNLARVVQVFHELLLTPGRSLLAGLHRMPPVVLRLEVRGAIAQCRSEPRDLLHGPRHGCADRPDSGVDALSGVDRAIGDLVHLVELPVDSINAASDFVDHGKNLAFRSRDERRKAPNGSAQADEQIRRRETDGEEEDRKREPPEIPPRECGDEHSDSDLSWTPLTR